MSLSINGGNNDPRIGLPLVGGTKPENITSDVSVSKPVQITSTNSVGRTDLSNTIADITARTKLHSPVALGLPTAEEVTNGQLVSGYYFDSLGVCDTKLFTLKYNSANAPQIANGTTLACDNIEYAEVASHIQSSDSPFAELFS